MSVSSEKAISALNRWAADTVRSIGFTCRNDPTTRFLDLPKVMPDLNDRYEDLLADPILTTAMLKLVDRYLGACPYAVVTEQALQPHENYSGGLLFATSVLIRDYRKLCCDLDIGKSLTTAQELQWRCPYAWMPDRNLQMSLKSEDGLAIGDSLIWPGSWVSRRVKSVSGTRLDIENYGVVNVGRVSNIKLSIFEIEGKFSRE